MVRRVPVSGIGPNSRSFACMDPGGDARIAQGNTQRGTVPRIRRPAGEGRARRQPREDPRQYERGRGPVSPPRCASSSQENRGSVIPPRYASSSQKNRDNAPDIIASIIRRISQCHPRQTNLCINALAFSPRGNTMVKSFVKTRAPSNDGSKAVRAQTQSSVVYEPTLNATKMLTKHI
jgi:hypothetical protein